MSAQIREAITKLGKVLGQDPKKGRSRNPSATARIAGGLVCDVTGPKGESLKTDMPAAVGGGATAPSPGWLLRASLAACEATVIAMRAAQLGVTLKTLEVTVDTASDVRGMIGVGDKVSPALDEFRTIVKIGADGVAPKKLREIVEWSGEHSPIGCTLRHAHEQSRSVEIID